MRAGGSVTLNTDVTEPEDDNDTGLAEISQVSSKTSVNHGNDVRFRDRLQLGHADLHVLFFTIGEHNTMHFSEWRFLKAKITEMRWESQMTGKQILLL